MDIDLLTESIKEKCLEIGFSKSGIAPVDYYQEDRDYLEGWIKDGYHASMYCRAIDSYAANLSDMEYWQRACVCYVVC